MIRRWYRSLSEEAQAFLVQSFVVLFYLALGAGLFAAALSLVP